MLKKRDRDLITLHVKLPRDLHAALVTLADDQFRSLNAEAVAILRDGLNERGASEPRASTK